VPKIISERCELVKLCHINRSGPVFLICSSANGYWVRTTRMQKTKGQGHTRPTTALKAWRRHHFPAFEKNNRYVIKI